MNKLKPNSIPRVDSREDGFRKCNNVVKFLGAAAAYGVPGEELFDAEDFHQDTGEAMARVAETILAIMRVAEAIKIKEAEREREAAPSPPPYPDENPPHQKVLPGAPRTQRPPPET